MSARDSSRSRSPIGARDAAQPEPGQTDVVQGAANFLRWDPQRRAEHLFRLLRRIGESLEEGRLTPDQAVLDAAGTIAAYVETLNAFRVNNVNNVGSDERR
jgi:hypothetical protein